MYVLAISPGEGFDADRFARVLGAGVDGLMLREKDLSAAELLRAARWARDFAPDLEVWVNGRLDVALAAGCGLHAPEAYPEVPLGLLPLSRPLHDPAQIPSRGSARQLILSPVYPVPGKGPALGPAGLHRALDALPARGCRALALGGITPANAAAIRHPRLDGLALIRALWAAADPRRVVGELRVAWNQGGFGTL